MSHEVLVPLVRRFALGALVLVGAAFATFEITGLAERPSDGAPAIEGPGAEALTTHASLLRASQGGSQEWSVFFWTFSTSRASKEGRSAS